MRDFWRMQVKENLAASTLLAQQRANEAKARAILQTTYGRVPEWHPVNFTKNVLPYDVHEQLRTILLEMRDTILTFSDRTDTDADMVTVDLVYCYPDKSYDGRLPAKAGQASAWRIITSGDGSCLNYKLHDFLADPESFYCFLDRNNFLLFNDKKTIERYYIKSGKDHEYEDIGSIVGVAIDVKNDAPEQELVKAMLTVTTYGWKLFDDGMGIKEEDFKTIFKQKVLNGYKSLLKSELTQMYIRHMVRDGKMCPYTGIVLENDQSVSNQPPFTCPLNLTRNMETCPLYQEKYQSDAQPGQFKCKCFDLDGRT